MKNVLVSFAVCLSFLASPVLSDTKLNGQQVLDLLYKDILSVAGGGCTKKSKSGYQWKWEKGGKVHLWNSKTGDVKTGSWHINNKGRMCQDVGSKGKLHCDQYYVYGSNNSKLRYTHHQLGKNYKPTRTKVAKYAVVSKCLF